MKRWGTIKDALLGGILGGAFGVLGAPAATALSIALQPANFIEYQQEAVVPSLYTAAAGALAGPWLFRWMRWRSGWPLALAGAAVGAALGQAPGLFALFGTRSVPNAVTWYRALSIIVAAGGVGAGCLGARRYLRWCDRHRVTVAEQTIAALALIFVGMLISLFLTLMLVMD